MHTQTFRKWDNILSIRWSWRGGGEPRTFGPQWRRPCLTASNATFDGGQVEVRSYLMRFRNPQFSQKVHISHYELAQDFKYVITVLRLLELPEFTNEK